MFKVYDSFLKLWFTSTSNSEKYSIVYYKGIDKEDTYLYFEKLENLKKMIHRKTK